MPQHSSVNNQPMSALLPPRQYKQSNLCLQRIDDYRSKIADCLQIKSPKRLLILGPCSIDNLESAIEYGNRLKKLQEKVSDSLMLIMRTYVEKPRTTVGWSGFIHDPSRNGSHDLSRGIKATRTLLLELFKLGIPCAAELLNPALTPYYSDLLSYASIGARTSESQIHRQLASNLPMPIGIKNPTAGDLTVAAHSVYAATQAQTVLEMNEQGQLIPSHSQGNTSAHLILRGSRSGHNYSPDSINQALHALQSYNCSARILIDCSHGNSQSCHETQANVARNIIRQSVHRPELAGLMLESYLIAGRQDPASPRQYGQSLTDACLSWEVTESLVLEMAEALAKSATQDKVICISAT